MRKTAKFPPLKGAISVPGDKSISHRALILGALASGRSSVQGLSLAGDVRSTISCLRALGAGLTIDEERETVAVEGRGWMGLSEPEAILDAGNSGTTMRLLLGVAAGLEGYSVLDGDETLRRRPMLRVVVPLRQMGAAIDGRRNGEVAPLSVRGRPLSGLNHTLRVASAQVKSALLLAGLRAAGTTTVTEPARSRDHTERMLLEAGVVLEREGTTVSLRGPQEVEPRIWSVPGDFSSAMFLIVAALLRVGSDLAIEGVGLNPTRTAALDVLKEMGANLALDPDEDPATAEGEPVGTVRTRHSFLRGVRVDGDRIPRLIDEIPALAIAATQAEGDTVFADADELRHKESDRVEVMVQGINALGGTAEATSDGFVVSGPSRLTGGTIDPRGDHRVALAFAVAGLVASGTVTVSGWTATQTSFPEFLEVLGQATRGR
ncbi:MAG: 3-phosphoshikimate 1-carboxyvinyltransferase [Actinomycetota bacterium]|nr:3-phosphoshikimate 1-carboxyvinyltransferase [Actinomycetota bacterium]